MRSLELALMAQGAGGRCFGGAVAAKGGFRLSRGFPAVAQHVIPCRPPDLMVSRVNRLQS